MKRLVFRYKGGIVSALMEKNRLIEICPYSLEKTRETIGNIYIGKVKNIVKSIDAAFIDIGDNTICFMSMKDLNPTPNNPHFKPLFIQRNNPQKLCPGDELVVQIVREPIKTKQACVSAHLSLAGRYCVLLNEASGINVSKKINDLEWRLRMKEMLEPYVNEELGLILRTNAYEVAENRIVEELEYLLSMYRTLLSTYPYRTAFSTLYAPDEQWLTDVLDTRKTFLEQIETDDAGLYQELQTYISQEASEDKEKLVYLNDGYPLLERYSLEKQLREALYERVWLPSSAYLIIQPTEALVVIDVNTGKSVPKKNMQEHIFQTNMEAAKEIAHQIRLRNLSGIIVIDFINMKSYEHKAKLLNYLGELLKADPILTNLVGMSQLELVQITRRKIRKPLYETFLSGSIKVTSVSGEEKEEECDE